MAKMTKEKQKQIVIANWKMNPASVGEAKKLFLAVRKEVAPYTQVRLVVAPPSVYLAELRKLSMGKRTMLASQDVFWEKGGAFTGNTSVPMLKSLGATYSIVGHSERRALGESDEMVARKVQAAVAFGMTAVVCVGEVERDAGGKYLGTIERQIEIALAQIPRTKLAQVHIAYEPVWAISTTANAQVATPEDVHEMVLFIRKTLVHKYGRAHAGSVPVLYGGSVHPKNVDDLVARGEADGFLVGGSSLKPKDFAAIVRSAHNRRLS